MSTGTRCTVRETIEWVLIVCLVLVFLFPKETGEQIGKMVNAYNSVTTTSCK